MSLVTGTKLGHYEIRTQLGAGGMGEVYLAHDTRLNRKVALKILPADVASNRDRMDRFIREAKSAAALSHPNIAQVFEIGEHDGIHYIAMEFIDGVTLREKIHRERTELRKLLRYLQHTAEGLAKAHLTGIVHRDLKPDNIMITREGHAKILDFGLAKLVEPTEQPIDGQGFSEIATAVMPQHSTPGMIMGTVGYMSPEQAQGKTKEIDQRSDIFSFGCILFEAATGKKPFEGDSVLKSLHMVVYEQPQPIAELNPSAPGELQRIVRRCLEKDPDDRYQGIKEVAIELKHLRRELETSPQFESTVLPSVAGESALSTSSGSTTAATAAASSINSSTQSSAEYVAQGLKRNKIAVAIALLAVILAGAVFVYLKSAKTASAIDSIAVLPFENRSNAADTDYLSEGLTESLIYRLSRLPNLKVSPTSSVIQYKGKDIKVSSIANELGVDAVMTGRLSQIGDNLTISVELIDVRNNKLLWGEQYERKMSDLLATQREIATEIAQKLQLKLSGEDEKALTKRYTNSDEAYQLYLKGRYHFAKRTKEDILKGVEYFQQAIKLDPNYALAYAGVADSYNGMTAYPYLSPKEAVPLAKAAAKRALEIDPTLAEAHTALANSLACFDWNWEEAEREFKRAIELNPNDSGTHWRYGMFYLMPLGRSAEAIAEGKRAVELEPLNLNNGANLSGMYFYGRQNETALQQAKQVFDLDPNFIVGRWALSQAYIMKGAYAEAIALNEQALKSEPTNQVFLRFAGIAYAKSGRRPEAEEIIRRFRELSKTQYVMSYYLAMIYADLGEKDAAFAELEKAFAEHDYLLQRLKVEPLLDPLHDDPRFKEMVKRLNLPE